MQQQTSSVTHPLALETKIVAIRPSCPCNNAKNQTIKGVVKKVISNQSGWWYYLGDAGITVRDIWVLYTE